MRLFLGVDGGQSGTLALIGDDAGKIIGSGAAGPVNHARAAEGRARFLSALTTSVAEAAAAAGLNAPRFECACFGFSGGPADKADLTRALIAAEQYVITHDAAVALTGATAGEPGIITIAGTGSIAFGRNAANHIARAGGWGYIYGDEGGGFDLARQAVRAALRQEEGWGPRTALHHLLLERSGAPDINDLLHRFYTDEYRRDRVATFSTVVDEAAAQGDAVAQELLKNAAQTLATLAAAVRGQLFRPSESAVVSYAGGVFRSPMLLERFRMLAELEDGNRVAAPIYDPAAGALLEAYRARGLRVAITY